MNASLEALQISLPLTDHESQPIPPYRIRVSPRARRMQIRVSPWRGIEIVVPKRHSRAERDAFIESHRAWMFQQWREICNEYEDAVNIQPPTQIGLPALGRHWGVTYAHGVRRRVKEEAESLTVLSPRRDARSMMGLLRRWLAGSARKFLSPRLHWMANQYGFKYQRLQIRGQDGRWGSCTSEGTITLNYKLLFLDIDLVDYLLVHELCHTRCLNHSNRYWQLVSEIEPEYRLLEARLDDAWKLVPGWANRTP